MAKTFYTLRDLQDLAAQGVTRLEYNDDVVITHEARDRAPHLGIELARTDHPRSPAPAGGRPETGRPETVAPTASTASDLHARVRTAVIAQLGGQVDPALLDRIITRVLAQLPASGQPSTASP